jgi:hypothetical protein
LEINDVVYHSLLVQRVSTASGSGEVRGSIPGIIVRLFKVTIFSESYKDTVIVRVVFYIFLAGGAQ